MQMRELLMLLVTAAGFVLGVNALWLGWVSVRRGGGRRGAFRRMHGRVAVGGLLAVSGAIGGSLVVVLTVGLFMCLYAWLWLRGRPVQP